MVLADGATPDLPATGLGQQDPHAVVGARARTHLRCAGSHHGRQPAAPDRHGRSVGDSQAIESHGVVHPPVRPGQRVGAGDGVALPERPVQQLFAVAAGRGRARRRRAANREPKRGFPRCARRRGLEPCLPVCAAGQPCRWLPRLDPRYTGTGLQAARLSQQRDRRAVWRGEEHGTAPARHLGQGGLRGRQRQPRRARDQPYRARAR
ncbi:unannotated protein [freshwater metagenome]|uniref:Unannotated protein n=1 Tax=freshwater metagenome TaxID=449393 RepID=A0A6J7FPC1_9ZZZZ